MLLSLCVQHHKISKSGAHTMEKMLKEWDPRAQRLECVVDDNGYQTEWKCEVCKEDHEPAVDCYDIKFIDKTGAQSLHREVHLCCGCVQSLKEMGRIYVVYFHY